VPNDDEKITKLSDVQAIFPGQNRQQMADDAPISSAKDAVEWLNKDHGTILLNGKFKVLHETP
jgi:hypothetical protein